MRYYTLLSKRIKCPFWKCNLTLQGKYYFLEEKGHEFEARFSKAKCPIIENNKLPNRELNKELALFAFCRIYPCEELTNFEPLIDVRTDKPPK